jgi:hypothetical protein
VPKVTSDALITFEHQPRGVPNQARRNDFPQRCDLTSLAS